MPEKIILDATPLGKIAHPSPSIEIKQWLDQHIAGETILIVPEIADYEVRRNLILSKLDRSLARLDVLKRTLVFLPITSAMMLKAAELWADARRVGRSTADPKELDAGAILAAQAIEAGAIVATENVGHLGRYVVAKHWRDIVPPT